MCQLQMFPPMILGMNAFTVTDGRIVTGANLPVLMSRLKL